jgi:hypothetical protein
MAAMGIAESCVVPGGSRSGNAALDCLETLERTLSDFVEAAKSAGYLAESPRKASVAAFARALGFVNQGPYWLEVVLEAMDNEADLNELPIESIWSASVPWSDLLVLTSSYTATIASTEVTFVWAADPDEGASQIVAAIQDIDQEVKAAIERLGLDGPLRQAR